MPKIKTVQKGFEGSQENSPRAKRTDRLIAALHAAYDSSGSDADSGHSEELPNKLRRSYRNKENSAGSSAEEEGVAVDANIITRGAWHPYENIFAVTSYNSLFVYAEKRSGPGGTNQIQQ